MSPWYDIIMKKLCQGGTNLTKCILN